MTSVLLVISVMFTGLVWATECIINSNDQDVMLKRLQAYDQNLQILFTQHARSAKLEATPNQPGQYQLTLQHVAPVVTYFSDRPHRVAGMLGTRHFLEFWRTNSKSGFKHDPPNASLETVVENSQNSSLEPHNFSVVLEKPDYNPLTRTLTYTVKPLSAQADKLPQVASLGDTTLFIDGVPWHNN